MRHQARRELISSGRFQPADHHACVGRAGVLFTPSALYVADRGGLFRLRIKAGWRDVTLGKTLCAGGIHGWSVARAMMRAFCAFETTGGFDSGQKN